MRIWLARPGRACIGSVSKDRARISMVPRPTSAFRAWALGGYHVIKVSELLRRSRLPTYRIAILPTDPGLERRLDCSKSDLLVLC